VLLSHGKAVPVIRANVPDAKVGIAQPAPAARGQRSAAIAAMERHDGLRYRWFLDPLYGRGYPAWRWNWWRQDAPPCCRATWKRSPCRPISSA
jgi:beta-glucosidase/6-phospho-beta-glucosidase/beta-galactosidase